MNRCCPNRIRSESVKIPAIRGELKDVWVEYSHNRIVAQTDQPDPARSAFCRMAALNRGQQ